DPELRGHLEAQIANAADEIAYTAHDLDDGLRSGMITPDMLAGLSLWEILIESLGLQRNNKLTEFRVRSVVEHKGLLLLSLEGLHSLEQAEEYRGASVFVKKESLGELQEDEYFWHELLGLKVFLDTGQYLGRISHIIPTGGTDVFVIKEGKRELMIPAAHDVVKEINLTRQSMVITPPEGLLELYEV
ncbi:MAG TPA: 16S rRNA processing protein RimM, partial [Desulfobacterales bacterium]|nr:16S rRNA processing protein RimM [Desulfobacterales bacterium]